MNVRVKAKEILEFTNNGKDCKLEISKDGETNVIPVDAKGYEDTILIQYFEAYDFEECKDKREYIEWLKDCFKSELEANKGQLIDIEIIE